MSFKRKYNRFVVLISFSLFIVILLYIRLTFSMQEIHQQEILTKNFVVETPEYKIKNKHFINRNLEKATQSNERLPLFFVILIQVHSRENYLKELIDSLRKTTHIQDALVIFSHDLNSNNINKLIESIDFCATLQIFYPYSLELYPNKFPGRDPNDCKTNLTKTDAILSKCNNAYYPDSYGNYRDASIVQIKHHWFWKLGFVFEILNETRNVKNLNVLLLEEDYYLLPDAIHTLRKLNEKVLSDIDVVSLGVFDNLKNHTQQTYMNSTLINLYSKAIFHSSSHNTGLTLARPQWNMLKECQQTFCVYDDYNWDFSFQYVSQQCFKLPLVSIFPNVSRVIHVGECGTHHKGKNCDPKTGIEKLELDYKRYERYFYPAQFNLSIINPGIHKIKKPNGGWSDPRDHELCNSFPQRAQSYLNIDLKYNCFILNGKNYCSNT